VLRTPSDATIIGVVQSIQRAQPKDDTYSQPSSIFSVLQIEVQKEVRNNGSNHNRNITALEAIALVPVDRDSFIPGRGVTYAFALDTTPPYAPQYADFRLLHFSSCT
jgi:hypothetical protein